MADEVTEVPAPAPAKPGWKTTEFWLTTIAAVLGAILGSGIVPEVGIWAQIAGVVTTLLATLGYQVSRTKVKAS